MFSAENKPHAPGPVDTIIGEKAKFKGEVASSGSLSINGEFDGKLVSQGEVIIGLTSKVTGTVHAGSVVVSGKVEGNITATHSLEITKSGKVHGDLTGGRIVIEDGASYRGRVQVKAEGEEAEPAPQP
jgi:cytoskeletal protein CcmA (bactofilin family)